MSDKPSRIVGWIINGVIGAAIAGILFVLWLGFMLADNIVR